MKNKLKFILGTAAIALLVVFVYDTVKDKYNSSKTALPASTTATT